MASLAGCGGSSEPEISDSGMSLVEARQAIDEGDTTKALAALDASIKSEPNSWAYLERGIINARQGADETVLSDCAEVLKLEPANKDVPWLKGELKKPVKGRFKGRFAIRPSFAK